MEIEMKSLITKTQAINLVEGKIGSYTISRGGGWRPFRKRDTYYSFNGEYITNPKDIIRVREEMEIGEDSFEDIIFGKAKDILCGTHKTFLTVKKKSTDENGIETNEETEGILIGDAKTAFEKSMELCNFKPYFQKRKDSVSLYVTDTYNTHEVHCEIVNVNGHGPYLEVEAIVPTINGTTNDFQDVESAQNFIKDFFYEAFGITEFDGRNWTEIINS